MKNKLLVTAFATVMAFAFVSCEKRAEVTGTCEDMLKESIHKSTRSLAELNGKALTVSEYEFMGGINDNRMLFRTISFGDSVYSPQSIDTLTYEYGEWNESNSAYSLYITNRSGSKSTFWYTGNAFITPEGRSYGSDGVGVTARVGKFEKTIASFPNTKWEGTYKGKLVMDSIFRDSIYKHMSHGKIVYDTIKIFTGKMDTLNADTLCYYYMEFDRDADSYANTGRFYQRIVRSKYDRTTQTIDTIKMDTLNYNIVWYFSDVSTDAKFVISLNNVASEEEGHVFSISKYKTDSVGVGNEFLAEGITFTRPVR